MKGRGTLITTMALTHLLYVSYASYLLSQEDLENILSTSVFRNEQTQITGLLLYCEGSFMQLLEGSESAIDALWQKLLKDSRHKEVKKLFQERIDVRSFPQWSMAFRRVDSPFSPSKGFSSFLQEDFSKNGQLLLSSKAFNYLLSFKESLA